LEVSLFLFIQEWQGYAKIKQPELDYSLYFSPFHQFGKELFYANFDGFWEHCIGHTVEQNPTESR
jgi:hypothetical protein